ncbi:hypothetical protein [Methylomonas fluvii]|uniref:Transporter n=1 Tax=Methylomonas fluvii TaxID=1854564 RepID=A0ABR9DFJ0_9GAMM|nr:hypothetical protein [Methylomonas fluvii]MBD9361029.1 hypothetical protein [Methylomonas fluvii]
MVNDGCKAKIAVTSLMLSVVFAANLPAKERADAGQHKKPVRNMPDIDVTDVGTIDIEQETNIFGSAAVANLSANYGLASGWDLGLSLLNGQFASTAASSVSFQPDVMLNVEKHWLAHDMQIIAGTQSGLGLLTQATVFMSFSYLEYQRHLPNWDTDLDTGLYYANAALAGFQSVGLHVNMEAPLFDKWRINGDYLSGSNALGAATVKLLYPVVGDWRLGLGVQRPNVYAGDHWVGLVGIYWH